MKNQIEDLEIYEGILKNIILGFLSLIMMFISVVIFNMAWESEGAGKIAMFAIGVIGIVFFMMGAYFCFKQVFIRKPVIILSTDGFINRKQSYSKKMPFIPWTNVTEMEVRDLLSESFLCIDLTNEEEYLASMSNSMRMGAKANQKMGYSVISISANTLKGYDVNSLYEEFEFYREINLKQKR